MIFQQCIFQRHTCTQLTSVAKNVRKSMRRLSSEFLKKTSAGLVSLRSNDDQQAMMLNKNECNNVNICQTTKEIENQTHVSTCARSTNTSLYIVNPLKQCLNLTTKKRMLERATERCYYSTSEEKNDVKKFLYKNLCSPSFPMDLRDAIDNVCAFQFRYDSIAWTHMSRDRAVLDWRVLPLLSSERGITQEVIYSKILEAVKQVPEGLVYVLEQPSSRPPVLRYYNFQMTMNSLRTSLYTQLRNKQEGADGGVYQLKSGAASRLFGLMVGGESVSGVRKVQDLIDDKDEYGSVLTSDELIKVFRTEGPASKALLADSLLLALAFYHYCVFNRS